MGALTVTINRRGSAGDLRYVEATATFSSSYATGGDTGLTGTALGLDAVLAGVVTSMDDGFVYSYNISSGNLLAYRIGIAADSGTAGANDSIMATASITGISGSGTAFQQALAQVTAATDLSTTPGSVRMFFLGK
jgi:hypothetical protein